jgi:hypothetical protein
MSLDDLLSHLASGSLAVNGDGASIRVVSSCDSDDDDEGFEAPKHVKPADLPRIFREIKRRKAHELDRLLTNDAELKSQINATPSHKGTPLAYAVWKANCAARLEHLNVLIKHGADVNLGVHAPGFKYDEVLTPMFVAIRRLDSTAMTILFNAGADMTYLMDAYSRVSKLHPLCTMHKTNAFAWALESYYHRLASGNASRPRGDPIVFMRFVKSLMEAHSPAARALLTSCVNSITCIHAKPMLGLAARLHAVGTAELLFELGADPNVVDEDGWTPLHTSCVQDDAGMVELLIKHGARDDLRTTDVECWLPSEKANVRTRAALTTAIQYRQWVVANPDAAVIKPRASVTAATSSSNDSAPPR